MLVTWLLLSSCLGASLGDEFTDRITELVGTRPAQWRVIWTTDPATRATIAWSTAEPGSRHVVHFDARPVGFGEPYEHSLAAARNGMYSRHEADRSAPASFHHARLSGLTAATTYRFRLESDGERSRELTFRTAPQDESDVSLLAGGDSRTGWRARCWVNTSIAELAHADESLLAFSHGGDYVMSGDRWDHWSAWLGHNELATTAGGRVLPIVPTRGNHDYGPLFDEVFDAPGGGTGYFRTRVSGSASLLTLNTNVSAAGDQLTWLERALAEAAIDSTWLVTSYHAPIYPAVKTPAPAKAFWPPVFDRFQLDLALESDGHCIKRTVPIRADEPHAGGVVYLGEGGLGVPQRFPRTDPWYLQPPGLVTRGHHVIRLDFTAEGLRTRILRFPDPPDRYAPQDHEFLVDRNEEWSYFVGDTPPGDWSAIDFEVDGWLRGRAGFGFGDDDDATVLEDMHRSAARAYLRTTFEHEGQSSGGPLNLLVRYDDAFIAYLNGVEIARSSVVTHADGSVDVASHEATDFESFPIPDAGPLLRRGRNVLALVGFNRRASDRDFTLDPWLAGQRRFDPSLHGSSADTIDDSVLRPRSR